LKIYGRLNGHRYGKNHSQETQAAVLAATGPRSLPSPLWPKPPRLIERKSIWRKKNGIILTGSKEKRSHPRETTFFITTYNMNENQSSGFIPYNKGPNKAGQPETGHPA